MGGEKFTEATRLDGMIRHMTISVPSIASFPSVPSFGGCGEDTARL